MPGDSETVDLRNLPPPEPMTRILAAIEDGAGPFVFLLSMEPRPLYPLLVGSGWSYSSRRDDRGVELTVSRRAKP